MQWLNTFIAALKRPINSDIPAYLTGFRRVSRGVSAFALPTSARPTPDVTRPRVQLSPEVIATRAAKTNPRNARTAAQAARVLTILNNGN